MPRSIIAPVNPALLEYARSSIGLAIEEVALLLNWEANRVRAWEKGAEITMGQVKKLAHKYRRPPLFFFLPEIPEEEDVQSLTDFRVLDTRYLAKYTPNLRYEIRHALETRQELIELYEDIEMREFLEPRKFFATNANPEDAGWQLRKFLGISDREQRNWRDPETAFRVVRQKIESFGVLVIITSMHYRRKIALEEMRGYAINEIPFPIIGINSSDKKGKIFSLIHEFFHLLLGHKGISHRIIPKFENKYDPAEVFCNNAAGAFLVPLQDLKAHELILEKKALRDNKFTISDIRSISTRFGVSLSVVARRLLTASIIESSNFEELMESISAIPTPKRDPDEEIRLPGRIRVLSHYGKLYTNAIMTAYSTGSISLTDATRYLNTNTNAIDQLQQSSTMIWDYLSPR